MRAKQWRWHYLIGLLFCTQALGQIQEKPIVISPLIGDTLDMAEQNNYLLLPTMAGFQWAVFYLNADSSLKVRVSFLQNDVKQDTIIQRYRWSLAALQYQINSEQKYKVNVDPSSKGKTVRILSVNVGIVTPSDRLSKYYGTGWEFGIRCLVFEPVRFVTGVLYTKYVGKDSASTGAPDYFSTVDGGVAPTTIEKRTYQSSSIFKIFAGPQFEIGHFYIVPSLAVNISGTSLRMGVDGIIGLRFEIKGNYVDVSGRYEVQNLVGTNDGEMVLTAIHSGIGIGFNF